MREDIVHNNNGENVINECFSKKVESASEILYSLYDYVDFLDFKNLKVKRIFTNNSDFEFAQLSDYNDYVDYISSNYIYSEDVEQYKAFSDSKTIKKRIQSESKNFIMSYFRTLNGKGEYVWKAYIVITPDKSNLDFCLSCIRSVDSATEHILMKNEYVRLFNDLPLAYAVFQINADDKAHDIKEIKCLYASKRFGIIMDMTLEQMLNAEILASLQFRDDVKKLMYEAAYDNKSGRGVFYSETMDKWFNIVANQAAVKGRCAIILEDVTKEHLSTEKKDMEVNTDDVIINCTKLLHSGHPHEIALDELLKLIGDALNADRVYIVEKIKNDVFSETFEWCRDNVPHVSDRFVNLDKNNMMSWESEYPGAFCLIVDDIELIKYNHQRLYNFLKELEVKSIIEFPILDDGETIGYFGAVNYHRLKNIDSRQLMETVSYFIASEFSRRKLLSELEHKSIYDGLCGIKNRSAMEMTTKKIKRRNYSVGVLYADANGLKVVNDTLGHEAGDALLKGISEIMSRHFDPDDIYRVGGDEFVVILPRVSKEDFIDSCKKLREDFAATQGISVANGWDWGASSTCVDDIMKTADRLMYEDKANYYKKNNRRRIGDKS